MLLVQCEIEDCCKTSRRAAQLSGLENVLQRW